VLECVFGSQDVRRASRIALQKDVFVVKAVKT